MKISAVFVVLAAIALVQAAPHKVVEPSVEATADIKPQNASPHSGSAALGKRGLVNVSNVKTKVCVPVKAKVQNVHVL
ncbi:hypothetical protein EMPS_08869 [Entomortierella parvispora]|uniref:Uncharacterized protein n=1 Tax=Entomortierella parvispora TaxID=205924 RepID=A0A9P3M022_9FUNG|nr:hypothetical protein EMPS_08869 [Entomortierella parvispora]